MCVWSVCNKWSWAAKVLMWGNKPCSGSTAGSHFLSHLVPNKMERRRQMWAVVCTSAGWISTSDGREESRTFLGTGCHFLSFLFPVSPSLPSYISSPPLWSLLSAPRSAASVRRETQNENKWGVGKVRGQRACLCAHVCVCACVYLHSSEFRSLPLLQCLAVEPKDRPGTLHPLAAERPRGWIEPCRLGYYQYSPFRQPGRQETEPLTPTAY